MPTHQTSKSFAVASRRCSRTSGRVRRNRCQGAVDFWSEHLRADPDHPRRPRRVLRLSATTDVADQRIDVLRPRISRDKQVVAGAQKWATDGTHYVACGVWPFCLATRYRWEPADRTEKICESLPYGAKCRRYRRPTCGDVERAVPHGLLNSSGMHWWRGQDDFQPPTCSLNPACTAAQRDVERLADQNSIVTKAIWR